MRANTGQSPTHLIIDAIDLSEVFHFGSLDYIYSSHTLEDFQDTESVLSGWVSLVRKGGHIVLFLPDEQVYRTHCSSTGQPYNLAHVHADMGLTFMRRIVHRMGGLQIIHELFPVPNNPYSFDLVLRKTQ
jgi:predicted SAM-dependent methyltransferase